MTKETVVGFEPSLRAKYFDTEIAADVQNACELWYKSIMKTNANIDNYGFIQNMKDNDMKYSIYTPKQHEQ